MLLTETKTTTTNKQTAGTVLESKDKPTVGKTYESIFTGKNENQ